MPITLSLKKFVRHANGTIEAVFTSSVSGETGRNYTGGDAEIADVIAAAETEEQAIAYFWAYWRARDDDFSNPNLMLGKNFVVDFNAANPIRVQ